MLGPSGAGRFTIVIATADFLALLVWLTSDDALVKYGFRYAANEEWGRFHRLIRVAFTAELAASLVASALTVAIVPFVDSIFTNGGGLQAPLLIAALLPPLQALESIAAATLILGGRYDLRGTWLTLSMGLRLVGIVVGAQIGVTAAVAGVVAAQTITTISILALGFLGLRRFPAAEPAPIGDDRGPIIRFVAQSAAYTGLISLRLWVAPLALGIVRNAATVGLFRAAQMPQTGLAALSSPLRMILLSEQTRDWEHGRPELVLQGIRRYVKGSALVAALALVPVLASIPWLVRHVLGADYLPAVPAARLILARRGDPARAQLDEDLPGDDRAPGVAPVGPRDRDGRDAAADRRARRPLGRDRRGRGGAHLLGRLRAHVGRDPRCASGGRASGHRHQHRAEAESRRVDRA